MMRKNVARKWYESIIQCQKMRKATYLSGENNHLCLYTLIIINYDALCLIIIIITVFGCLLNGLSKMTSFINHV